MSTENAIVATKPSLLQTLSKEDYSQMAVGAIDNMLQVRVIASFLAESKFLPQSLRKDPATAITLVITAKQMGLPITALSEVCEVNGKISFWGRTKAGILFRDARCEYVIPVQKTEQVCTLKAKRKGWPEAVEVTYTIGQAEKAGLTGKDPWKKYPADMLYYRALSRVINEVFPDVIQGIATAEDIQDGIAEAEISEEGLQAPKQIETPKEKKTKSKQAPITPVISQPAQGIETPAENQETIDVEGEAVNVETGEVVSEPIADAPADISEAPEEEQKKEIFRVVERISTLPTQTATGLETVRKVICKNDLIPSSPSESYSLGSLEMATALKRLQGTKVKLSIYKGAVVSFEESK